MHSMSPVLSAAAIAVAVVAAGAPVTGANSVSLSETILPDLVVDGIYSIASIPDGDSIVKAYVHVDVFNGGSAPSDATTLTWRMQDLASYGGEAADQSAGRSVNGVLALPALPAGMGVTLTIDASEYADGASPSDFGRWFIHATVDADLVVAESDESNNEHFGSVFGGRTQSPSS